MFRIKLVASIALFVFIGLSLAAVPDPARLGEDPSYNNGPIQVMAASGDILALNTVISGDPKLSILRRGLGGNYTQIAVLDETDSPVTNGEWIAVLNAKNWNFYQIGVEGIVQSLTADTYSNAGFFGNVLVGALTGVPNKWDIYTYEGQWGLSSTIEVGDQVMSGSFSTISQDGKTLVSYNETHTDIWEFQPSESTFVKRDSFEYDNTYSILIIYNGNDTVIGTNFFDGAGDVKGAIVVYTKANGQWSLSQKITATDLGLRGSADLGTAAVFIDQNTVAVAARSENLVALPLGTDSPSGKVVVLTRGVDGMWSQAYQLEADPADTMTFGMNTLVNSHKELLVPSFNLNDPKNYTGFIYSTCLTAPINVTCNNVEVSNCDTLDTNTLYTLDDSVCKVNVTLVSATPGNNQVIAEYLFTKPGQSSVSCTSTVTCQSAPVTAGTPVASTPSTTPGKKASSATVIEFFGIVVLAMALAL